MTRPIYTQLTGSATSVGTGFSEISLTGAPVKGRIRRVRADITAGSGTTVGAKALISSGGSGFDVIVGYALTADPLDSEENLYYSLTGTSTDQITGTLYLAVQVNSGSDTTVQVSVDIEAAA